MKTAGFVAEFDPFHAGHAYLLRKAKEAGAEAAAVVMSGCFTQRGAPAAMPPAARCAAALACGADLVVELPLPWAMAPADTFARGAVFLLSALGCVDTLAFGSESGDAEKLAECARLLKKADGSPEMARALAAGKSFPRARAEALRALFPKADLAPLFSPNDTLALAYLRAMREQGAPFSPLAVRRVFAAHGGEEERNGFASASHLRRLLAAGRTEEALAFMPAEAAAVCRRALDSGAAPFQLKKAEPAVLSYLRRLTAADFAQVPDVSEGLENRLAAAAGRAERLEELTFAVKSKRVTLARVRRILWSAFLGIEKRDAAGFPPYLRVLGFTEKGKELLRCAKKTGRLPVLTRYADAAGLPDAVRRLYDLECRAYDQYGFFLPKSRPAGLLARTGVIVPRG